MCICHLSHKSSAYLLNTLIILRIQLCFDHIKAAEARNSAIYKYNSCTGNKKHEITVCNHVHCSAISKYSTLRSITYFLSVLGHSDQFITYWLFEVQKKMHCPGVYCKKQSEHVKHHTKEIIKTDMCKDQKYCTVCI